MRRSTSVEASEAKGRLHLASGVADKTAVWIVEDDGPEERLGADEALRGRPLVCAIARHLLEQCGGWLEITRDGETTRIAMHMPRES